MSQPVAMSMPPAAVLPENSLHEDDIYFGSFRLSPRARTLDKDGSPVEIGSRALDILIVLIERAGEIVSHKELMAKVWRGLVVEGSNLRVNVALLRTALGDDGACIHSVRGQGYSFVAPIVRSSDRKRQAVAAERPTGSREQRILPPTLSRMIGRDESIRAIAKELRSHRFITLTGPGGMGKTTTAIAVAHLVRRQFSDAVCFVDLGAVSNPAAVAATIATLLGLATQGYSGISSGAFIRRARRRRWRLFRVD